MQILSYYNEVVRHKFQMKTSINTFETVIFIKLIFQRTLILGASLPFSEKYIKVTCFRPNWS